MLGDCLEEMRRLPEQSIDLVFGSPPYEDARTYGIGFNLKGQEWVDWMVTVYRESLRVCRGLVAFVVAGRTKHYAWTATPALLMADLYRAGVCVRNPPIYCRSGIPGSGGPDWLRSDYEWIICATNGGKLPWSDNIAMGDEPKYGPGGDPTHRKQNGERVRVSGMVSGARHDMPHATHGGRSGELQTDGTIVRLDGSVYRPPEKANPGNVIRCSGGHLGSKIAHENEAPFPEKLAEFFVRSFCPPGGVVLDPFGGSGTTAAVAEKHGRRWITIDIRPSQIELINRRIAEVRPPRPAMPTIQ
jgi:hypothetical protein